MGCSCCCIQAKTKSESEKIAITIGDKHKLSLEGILRQEDLFELCNNYFRKLEELTLSNNDLIDISPLKELKAPKLKKIDLSHNKIENVTGTTDPFKDYIFPQLEELNLSYNNLSNIYELKAFIAPNLKILDISFNQFDNINLAQNIDIFKFNFNFPKLEQLNNLFYTKKNADRTVCNKKINDKKIEGQINNPQTSSYKLTSKE